MAELFGKEGGCREGAAARCTCSTSSGASWAATGSSAATCRSRPASASPPTARDGRRDALHVRRRRLEPGHVRRDDEPRRAVEAAGRLHGHEQPVRDGHLARTPLRGDRPPAQGRGLRRARRRVRRHGRDGRPPRRRRGAAARARGAPADAGGGDHVPLPRALDGRPRGVPHERAGRRVAQRDPIALWSARLVEEGVLDEGRPSRSSTRRRARRSTRRSRSPTARRSRRPSRSTTTSTCSATRCAAGTRSTSARRACTAARTSAGGRSTRACARSTTSTPRGRTIQRRAAPGRRGAGRARHDGERGG